MAMTLILAETLAVTELNMLFRSPVKPSAIRALDRLAGLIAGPWCAAASRSTSRRSPWSP
jgi:hypothetical protein